MGSLLERGVMFYQAIPLPAFLLVTLLGTQRFSLSG